MGLELEPPTWPTSVLGLQAWATWLDSAKVFFFCQRMMVEYRDLKSYLIIVLIKIIDLDTFCFFKG